MNQAIQDLKSTTFSGRRFARKQIAEIQQTVQRFSRLSRRELAHTICEHFQWFTPNGENRVQLCLGVLEELEKLGIITLPAIMENKKRGPQKKIVLTDKTNEQTPLCCSLEELMPLQLQIVRQKEQTQCWNEFVERYHYLGYKRPIGSHLRYYIIDQQGRKLGCLLFSFATQTLPCRDQWIGWSIKDREKNLQWVINNNRFLIFPWVHVKCLASKVLSMATAQIGQNWEEHHGYQPVLLETFVDQTKYKGTCYQAANWQQIGKTAGRQRSNGSDSASQKTVYVYPLVRHFRSALINSKMASSATKVTSLKTTQKNDTLSSSDPFLPLWQNIIRIVGKVADDFDRQWQKRQRVLNTMMIILFIFRLVFSKNKQGYGITIIELWEQCRTLNIPLPQPKPVAASAFCNARAKLDECIFKTLNADIIRTYETTHLDYQWKNHRTFAVDGSTINLPRQLKDFGYHVTAEHTYYPQGLLSCLYQLKSKIPTDFDLVAHQNERKAALTHLDVLRENDIVVYDRGYFSYVMLYTHLKRGIHAVFRIQKNTFTIIDEFLTSSDIDQEVVIELTPRRQQEIFSKNPEIDYMPLRLRLVKYVRNDVTYLLGTTLLNNEQYQVDELAELYYSRWGIEELYKVSKVLIDVEDFHGQSERGVKQELFAHFILITLSRIFSNQTEDDFSQKENSQSRSAKFKANLKNCLITIARNLEGLFLKQATLVKKTINKIMTSIATCRQRVRPNRSYDRVSRKPVKKWRPTKAKKNTREQVATV